MILVDTSVWVDHLRNGDARLSDLLAGNMVMIHPFAIGEVALGSLRHRDTILRALESLPPARIAAEDEMLPFIDRHGLFGLGIGYVDVHLLASALLTGAKLWTRDKRLRDAAIRLAIAADHV